MHFLDNLDWGLIPRLLSYQPEQPMLFSSGLFLWLFLLFLPVYIALRNTALMRIVYVSLFSLFFYYKSSGLSVLLLLFAASSDYIIGHMLYRSELASRRKMYVALSVCINLLILSYFKYFNFLADLGISALHYLGLWTEHAALQALQFTPWDIVLPVGISFYTFQTMSYIIDIYRGEIKPLPRWIDYVFYISFFPQLVAGPIVRARDFVPQIYQRPRLSRSEYSEALLLIMSGLIKKTIISDYISLNFVDRIFDAPTLYTGLENLMGVYGYALQIYCDFSGYSDMAIGIALILGFRFNINFDSPYQSASITEFWRRWHISLSSWLRDYLYIPLGGNRRGSVRTYINLFLTMLLGGLWHGAAFRFVLWGAIHGIALAVHKVWCHYFPSSSKSAETLPIWRRYIGRIVTFHLVCFTWIFFRADNMQIASEVLLQIGTNFHPEVLGQFITGYRWVLLLMLLGYAMHFVGRDTIAKLQSFSERIPFVIQALLLFLLIFLITQVRSSEIQPFIYFQF